MSASTLHRETRHEWLQMTLCDPVRARHGPTKTLCGQLHAPKRPSISSAKHAEGGATSGVAGARQLINTPEPPTGNDMCFSTPSFPNRTVAVQKIARRSPPTSHPSQPRAEERNLHGKHHQTRRRPAETGHPFPRDRSCAPPPPATPATPSWDRDRVFPAPDAAFSQGWRQKSIILSLLRSSISSPICEWLPNFPPFLHFAFRISTLHCAIQRVRTFHHPHSTSPPRIRNRNSPLST
jgi:hypothetical protein